MLTCVLRTDLVAQVLRQVVLRVFRQIECIVSNTRISFERLHQSFCHQSTRLFSRHFPVAVNVVYEQYVLPRIPKKTLSKTFI